MQSLQQLKERFAVAQKSLGLYDFADSRKALRQRWLLRFLFGNLMLLNLLYFLNIIETQDPFLKVLLGVQWTCISSFSFFYFLLIRYKYLYQTCLDWCDSLLSKWLNSNVVGEIFQKCIDDCTALFKLMLRELSMGVAGLCLLQVIVQSIFNGEFTQLLEIHLPLTSKKNRIDQVFCCINQAISVVTMLMPLMTAFGVIAVTIQFAMSVMDAIKKMLQVTKLSEKEFHSTIRTVIIMHLDMMDRLKIVANMASIPLLAFEFSSYGLLLLIWVITFFKPSLFMMAGAASGEFIIYFVICWINEKLIDAFRDLQMALYDFEWYRLTPKQRKMMLLVMITASRHTVLTAGPFHNICYEELGFMLKRIYSVGIMINKMIV